MKGFGYFLICTVIGAFFGSIGMWIGIAIGIFAWAGASSDKTADKSKQPNSTIPQFPFIEPTEGALNTNGTKSKANVPPFPKIDQNFGSPKPLQSPSKPSYEQLTEYATSVSHTYARVLSHLPVSDTSTVNVVTNLVKNDEWITDKFDVMSQIAKQVTLGQIQRRDSPMHFQLESNTVLERLLRLPKPMVLRLATQLDSLSLEFADHSSVECKSFIERFVQALRSDASISTERMDAEAIIMRSGDQKAISTLQEMRRNPSRYKDMLRNGATGNTVLKTAFGVFAGMLAADAVRAAVTDYQMKNLLTQLDHDIDKAGGVDKVELMDKELEAQEAPSFSDTASSSFNDGEETSWQGASDEELSADVIDEETDEANFDSSSVSEDTYEAETETLSTESSSDYSYSSDD